MQQNLIKTGFSLKGQYKINDITIRELYADKDVYFCTKGGVDFEYFSFEQPVAILATGVGHFGYHRE